MRADEYKRHQDFLSLVASMARATELDWSGFIEAMNRAETIGPILDPTLYMKGAGALAVVKSHAQAIAPFMRLVCDAKVAAP